jgi:mannose-6-phosphate isomerase-like protein (cupin superfamily)
MENSENVFRHMLDVSFDLLKDDFPDVPSFMGGLPAVKLGFETPVTHRAPLCDLLPDCIEKASAQTLPMVKAIIEAVSAIEWQVSYTLEDGFDVHYLANYGWFNLVSPEGPFVSNDFRISFGYWGEGLHYKEHWHEPEEIYVPLSGQALFHSKGVPSRICGPGDTVYNKSNQPHSIDMKPDALLAMAVWRGANLTRKPGLPSRD